MSYNDLEKIHRALFKQEQQNKKKFSHNNNNEIMNIEKFFEFNDIRNKININPPSPSTSFYSEKEIKSDSFNDDKKINYEINSYLENEYIPDLYTPLGKISGENYKFNQFDLDTLNIENNIYDIHNDKKIISKKRLRYFDLDEEEPEIIIRKISKKRNNRNFSKNRTPFELPKFCYICLSTNHFNKNECPKYKRCFKCLQYGHWAKNCQEIIQNKCENCHTSSHTKEDCLKFKENIKYENFFSNMIKNGLKCAFCEKKNHLICPFSKREKYILNYKNNNKEKKSEKIKDYSETLFCPFCGGNHLKKNCPENFKDKISNNSNNSIFSFSSDNNYWSSSSNYSSKEKSLNDNNDNNNNWNNNYFDDFEINLENKNNIDMNHKTKNNFQQNNNYNEKVKEKNNNYKEMKSKNIYEEKKDDKIYYKKPYNYNRNKQNNQNNRYQTRYNYRSKSLYTYYNIYKDRIKSG